MASVVIKNGHQKDTFHFEDRLCAQNIDTDMISTGNTIGRTHYVINYVLKI
jgi:hypothetical protein